jgi:hypothetical protein
MKRKRTCKCKHCKEYFHPDPRVVKRQKFYSKPACRQASKAQSQRRWLSKAKNRNYFCGSTHVRRIQPWRAANAGYWRRAKAKAGQALQDESSVQATDLNGKSSTLAHTTSQDLILAQPFVLIGLLANLSGYALQDDIAAFAHRLHTLGRDIINSPTDGGKNNSQTFTQPPTLPPRAPSVQLGGSAPGTR